MFMPSIHVVGWCPVFAKLSMQILDNNNYNRNENTKHMLRGYVWASGLIRTQNILLMWHRNWPVIIQWKCNQCMCVRARVCLIHMLYAPPSHTPVPCLASHCIETDKSVCIIHLRSSTKENAHCNGHTDDQNTKEEEVYHDLCAIHRATRSQVLFFCCTPFFFYLILLQNTKCYRFAQLLWKWDYLNRFGMFYFISDLKHLCSSSEIAHFLIK